MLLATGIGTMMCCVHTRRPAEETYQHHTNRPSVNANEFVRGPARAGELCEASRIIFCKVLNGFVSVTPVLPTDGQNIHDINNVIYDYYLTRDDVKRGRTDERTKISAYGINHVRPFWLYYTLWRPNEANLRAIVRGLLLEVLRGVP